MDDLNDRRRTSLRTAPSPRLSSERSPLPQVGRKRRKKTTLSCEECVAKKAKCDRQRPSCTSCVRRQSKCSFAVGFTASAERDKSLNNTIKHTKQNGILRPKETGQNRGGLPSRLYNSRRLIDSHQNKTFSADPKPALFNPIGMSSKHPFQNYWTWSGGLSEVVDILPLKNGAISFVESFLANVDPLYPVLQQPEFQEEHEAFWALSVEEKCGYEADKLALNFAIYAAGVQFSDLVGPNERESMADLYLSASHQSLCLHSYLNCFSIATIQTMVLITYVLIGKGHTSEAWTLSGITQRQAYSLKLNRIDGVDGEDSGQQQLRCRLWQAVMFQDTNLSMYLELPPSTIYHNLKPTLLKQPGESYTLKERRAEALAKYKVLTQCLAEDSSHRDTAYLQVMWEYAEFVQQNICIPGCLGQGLCSTQAEKIEVISQYRSMYSQWSQPWNSYNPERFDIPNKRLARQLIAASSNYFFVMTIICIYEDKSRGILCDVHGAMEASHEGLLAFFALGRLNPPQVDSWGAYHTRAYFQAKMLGTVLAAQAKTLSPTSEQAKYALAKSDFDHYLDILTRCKGTENFEASQKQRLLELQKLRNGITVA